MPSTLHASPSEAWPRSDSLPLQSPPHQTSPPLPPQAGLLHHPHAQQQQHLNNTSNGSAHNSHNNSNGTNGGSSVNNTGTTVNNNGTHITNNHHQRHHQQMQEQQHLLATVHPQSHPQLQAHPSPQQQSSPQTHPIQAHTLHQNNNGHQHPHPSATGVSPTAHLHHNPHVPSHLPHHHPHQQQQQQHAITPQQQQLPAHQHHTLGPQSQHPQLHHAHSHPHHQQQQTHPAEMSPPGSGVVISTGSLMNKHYTQNGHGIHSPALSHLPPSHQFNEAAYCSYLPNGLDSRLGTDPSLTNSMIHQLHQAAPSPRSPADDHNSVFYPWMGIVGKFL